MTDNVIKFKRPTPEPRETLSEHLLTLNMYEDSDGHYEVYMEVAEWADDDNIAQALMSAWMKFCMDHGMLEEELDGEDEGPGPVHH